MPAERELLAATAASGFISGETIAAVLGLEERLIIELLDRVGGVAHFPDLATTLAEPDARRLVAEIDDDGVYVLSIDPLPPVADA